MSIECIGYTKKYEEILFDQFNLRLNEGSVTVLLGNSGVGKTTLLNAFAGLDGAFEGQVNTRPCAYIFQEPRLLKGATVRKNVYLACHNEQTAQEYLEAVELTDYANRYPAELSGGMAARVSMARAFASGRKLLLMDEPFSSMDLGLKNRLYKVFRSLWEKTHPTTLLITHDLDEALSLADRVVLLEGRPVRVALDELVTPQTDIPALKEKLKNILIS